MACAVRLFVSGRRGGGVDGARRLRDLSGAGARRSGLRAEGAIWVSPGYALVAKRSNPGALRSDDGGELSHQLHVSG